MHNGMVSFKFSTKPDKGSYSIGDIVTSDGLDSSVAKCQQKQEIFLLHTCNNWTWDQPSLLHNRYKGYFIRIRQLMCDNDHPTHLVRSVRMKRGRLLLPLSTFIA